MFAIAVTTVGGDRVLAIFYARSHKLQIIDNCGHQEWGQWITLLASDNWNIAYSIKMIFFH